MNVYDKILMPRDFILLVFKKLEFLKSFCLKQFRM